MSFEKYILARLMHCSLSLFFLNDKTVLKSSSSVFSDIILWREIKKLRLFLIFSDIDTEKNQSNQINP